MQLPLLHRLELIKDGICTHSSHVCRNGHLEVVKQLNKDGANLEADDNTGRTPLHRACMYVLHWVVVCCQKST